MLKVPENSEADSVKFSLIGYEKYKVTIEDLQHHPNFRMSRSSTSLSEVTIVAEEDPAYAMIRRAVKRRKFNDPEKLNNFVTALTIKLFLTYLERIQFKLNLTAPILRRLTS